MIAEAQLDIWASQGPTAQFTDTYNRIRDNLLDGGAPYPLKDTEVFLQGSYNNDTNVYGDSDVDIVLCHTGAFTSGVQVGVPTRRRNSAYCVVADVPPLAHAVQVTVLPDVTEPALADPGHVVSGASASTTPRMLAAAKPYSYFVASAKP